MTAALFLVAAGAAALMRHGVNRLVPWWGSLLFVNTVGAGLLGALLASDAHDAVKVVVGTGFCGTLTTFSSFALETRILGPRWGTIYAAASIGAAGAAAAIGTALVGG
jgi:CrcB protein